jgi:transposase InsO family protein
MRVDQAKRLSSTNTDEAKVLVEARRKTYNRIRPHSSLGYRPPVPEAHVVGNITQGLV